MLAKLWENIGFKLRTQNIFWNNYALYTSVVTLVDKGTKPYIEMIVYKRNLQGFIIVYALLLAKLIF